MCVLWPSRFIRFSKNPIHLTLALAISMLPGTSRFESKYLCMPSLQLFVYFKKKIKSMTEEVVHVLREGYFLLVHLVVQKLILLIHHFSD